MAARVVYAVNWYNIASIFSQIASDFKTDVSGLGLLTSSLYLALAIFQVPGGLLAAKYGPRRVSFAGVLIASVSSLLVSSATNLTQAILLRFGVGMGMAFFFSPGLSLVAKYFRSGAEGLGIGLYNSAFDLGGALGLFGWASIAVIIGWRQSLLTSGALGVATAILLLLAVPKEAVTGEFRLRLPEVRSIIFDPRLLILSLNLLGQGIGSTLVASFMVFYLEDSLGLPYQSAGSVGALVLLVPLLLSPVGGRIYDRSKRVTNLMLLSGLAMAVGVSIPSVSLVYAAIAATIIIGVASGVGFTVAFAALRERVGSRPEYESLAVSWANSISLLGGFLPPVVFSYVASIYGYSLAWLVGGFLTLVFVLSIVFLPRPMTRVESR